MNLQDVVEIRECTKVAEVNFLLSEGWLLYQMNSHNGGFLYCLVRTAQKITDYVTFH